MDTIVTDRLTPSNALNELDANEEAFLEVLRHGSLQVEIYKPDGVDRQTAHTRDEVYVVISGSGQFLNGNTKQPFEAGEVLFVPAGVEHRFEDSLTSSRHGFSSTARKAAKARKRRQERELTGSG